MTRRRPRRLRAGVAMGCAAAALGGPASASAQGWVVEARAGAAVGNYSETAAGLEYLPGPLLGLSIEAPWRWLEIATPYAGISWVSFGCEEGFCTDRDATIRSWGVALGLRWAYGPVWLRTGGVIHGLDVAAAGGAESVEPGLGFELQGGAGIPVTDRLALTPQAGYLRHAADAEAGPAHVTAISLALGFRYRLGDDPDPSPIPAPPRR